LHRKKIKINKMKAVRINEFGGTEVLKIQEIERPVPAADEILIKVYASSVNPADWVVREGENDFLNPILKLPLILGWDTAGIVEEVGGNVTGFKEGDEVYGLPNFPGDGSYAEYVAAKASQFALKPEGISFNEAASVPLAALVAWTALFELGKLQAGQRIFIHGASGGVGSFAVQFAKAKGAYVTGSASTGNQEFLKQIGADEAIDYKKQKFEELLQDIDVVFDGAPLRDDNERLKCISVLKEGGIYVSVNIDFPFSDKVPAALAKKNAKGEVVGSAGYPYSALNQIAQLINDGKVKVIISKIYPLEQVAEAHKESETFHVRSKLVLEIRKENDKQENSQD
jgi:NADPH:quinone reductase-like Zn-dependent oxidoreductase